jgi:Flp pilus assembly protein TadD
LYNLGCTLIRQNAFDQAIAALERSVDLNPSNAEARINLGFAYSRTNRTWQAITQFEEALRLKPEDAEAQFFLGKLYLAAHNKRLALARYEMLRPMDPILAKQLYTSITNGRVVFVSEK